MSGEPRTALNPPVAERPIDTVRGTRDWLPEDFKRFAELEALLLDRFARAGYEPLRTPVLEFTELHERKSGAGIVAKLFELSGSGLGGICLRPELTAGIVRAYTAAAEPPRCPGGSATPAPSSGTRRRGPTASASSSRWASSGSATRGRWPTLRSSGSPAGRWQKPASWGRRSGSATSG